VIYFKSCPRCTGDVFFSEDDGGPTLTCLQCSRYWGGRRPLPFDVSAPEDYWSEVEDSGFSSPRRPDLDPDAESWEQERAYA